MDRRMRFSREPTRESKGNTMPLMQKKLAEKSRLKHDQPVPDLTDFMNDMFFGTMDADKKAYDLRGDPMDEKAEEEEAGFDDSTRSNSSKLTEEWLEEARRMVALSPSRSCDSPPSRLLGSPRFAAAAAPVIVKGRLSVSSVDRRDPLSRSARRQRAADGFGGEILSKSANHSRNRSEVLNPPASDLSPASAVHKWFSNILNPSSSDDQQSLHRNSISHPVPDPPQLLLPPCQPPHRKSRFQTDPISPSPPGIPIHSRRTFKTTPPLPADTHLLSPPKTLVGSSPRRSVSSSTENRILSPPRNLVESAHRRSIAASTCAVDRAAPTANGNGPLKEKDGGAELSLNGFLRKQNIRIEIVMNGEANVKAKIVLSGPSNSTSSMVAAVCYAWLLEKRMKKEKAAVEHVVVPVMNIKREEMWKHWQAAWLFHHVGLDVTSLLFADEVDLESLVMAGKLNMLIVGQDVLKTNGEDGSQCTVLTDNYCEDAYDLLETPILKKLLLAGIVLDTRNLKEPTTVTRDAEAVQLLLVGSPPNYRNTLYDQLAQDQIDTSFLKALKLNYGEPPNDGGRGNEAHMETRKSNTSPQCTQNSDNYSKDKVLPNSAKHTPLQSKPASDASKGKNKSFLAKWFGFGSK